MNKEGAAREHRKLYAVSVINHHGGKEYEKEYIYIYIYIHTHTHTHIHTCTHIHVYICKRMYTYTNVYMHTHTYVYTCVRAYIYMYIIFHILFHDGLSQDRASQVAPVVKNTPFNAGVGSIPGLGRFPGEGHGNPLQYFCLENLKDRGA